ncbi:hypothetical protein TrST_g6176 [Triparma strigata]|uniref:ABC1 atypical kinase-like domain-containing protein n=2 Tax=Triparma strigata TaxID=1606541 RepID=A0A9W7F1A7_9STRA|nr:hypothetical protein TrST_g6176 [Triparma strigata]
MRHSSPPLLLFLLLIALLGQGKLLIMFNPCESFQLQPSNLGNLHVINNNVISSRLKARDTGADTDAKPTYPTTSKLIQPTDQPKSYYYSRPHLILLRLTSLTLPFLFWYLRLLSNTLLLKLPPLNTDEHSQSSLFSEEGLHLKSLVCGSKSVALLKSIQVLTLRTDLSSFLLKKSPLNTVRLQLWNAQLSTTVSDVPLTFSPSFALEQISLAWNVPLASVKKIITFTEPNAIAGASIGQVYKIRLNPCPELTSLLGPQSVSEWTGRDVALKVQRPEAPSSVGLDVFLLREFGTWLSKSRGGDVEGVINTFCAGLIKELDYVNEAENGERFYKVYGEYQNVKIPRSCAGLTRRNVLIQEWIEGTTGPWKKEEGMDMVRTGIKCCVSQLMETGYFHADPHRGNLVRTVEGELAFIDFGMMADVSSAERYGLIGLVFGLQNKDLELITENLLNLGFLNDTTQIDILIPRLRAALKNATGGTGKARDMNFASLQTELDAISSENVLQFQTPPFFTVIIRTLTILEGMALSVDPEFRLVKGAYPFVLRQVLGDGGENGVNCPEELKILLIKILVNKDTSRINWQRLNKFLSLAQSASSTSTDTLLDSPSETKDTTDTLSLFFTFLTSDAGLFLKQPLVHEIAQTIDMLAIRSEISLENLTSGLIKFDKSARSNLDDSQLIAVSNFIEMLTTTLLKTTSAEDTDRLTAMRNVLSQVTSRLQEASNTKESRKKTLEIVEAATDVAREVAVEVLEIRSKRAVKQIFGLAGV